MVPVKIDSQDPRVFFFNIVQDRKIVIFNPLHSKVHNLSGNAMALEEVRQSKEPHRQKINPDKMIDGPIVIYQLGNVEKKAIQLYHRGNCKMFSKGIATSPQIFYSERPKKVVIARNIVTKQSHEIASLRSP